MPRHTHAQSQTAFLTAFVAGVGTIIFVALFRLHDGLAIVGPILAMAIYFWWVRDRSGDQADVEQYADSFYYLGFLFTLVALLVAVLPSVWLKSISMESLFGRLGLALITTILGLGGRIVLTQFRTSADQDVQHATAQLVDAVIRVAVELDTSLAKLVETREKTVEKIEAAAVAAARTTFLHSYIGILQSSVAHQETSFLVGTFADKIRGILSWKGRTRLGGFRLTSSDDVLFTLCKQDLSCSIDAFT